MPCLSSSAASDLKESIRVSNAESQLALPLAMTTIFGSSVICSPKGSAVWTGAGGGVGGVWAVEGMSAGDLVSAGGGAGVAVGPGAGAAGALAAGGVAGGVADWGDCASASQKLTEIAAIGTSATVARRNERANFIRYSPEDLIWAVSARRSRSTSKDANVEPVDANTRARRSSHERYFIGYPSSRKAGRHRFAALANPPSFAI